MHGAGLYAAVAMKAPAILEFTTQRIPNRNAYNLMSHIGGCYQGMEIVAKDKVNGPGKVWGDCTRGSGAGAQGWLMCALAAATYERATSMRATFVRAATCVEPQQQRRSRRVCDVCTCSSDV
eukprot:scaffold152961_cov19-Tisochrysis_lutea.AAC.2